MEDMIVIRKMDKTDVEEAWELIRTGYELWSFEKILMNIEELFVIIYQKRIISVLNGRFSKNNSIVYWTAVHPSYPENSISSAFAHGLLGILSRKPVGDLVQNKTKCISQEKCSEPGDIHCVERKKAEGVKYEISFEQKF